MLTAGPDVKGDFDKTDSQHVCLTECDMRWNIQKKNSIAANAGIAREDFKAERLMM